MKTRRLFAVLMAILLPVASVIDAMSGQITGQVDMVGETEVAIPLSAIPSTRVVAQNGPLAAHMSFTLAPPYSGGFVLDGLPPSDSVVPAKDYEVGASLNIRTGRRLEAFTSPFLGQGSSTSGSTGVNPPVLVPESGAADLGATFVMQPGYVHGALFLQGPTESLLGHPSALRGIVRLVDIDANHDGIPDVNPDGDSRVSAAGAGTLKSAGATYSAAGAQAFASFDGEFNDADSAFVGDYELVLAGLLGQASYWERLGVQMRLRSGASDTPETYVNEKLLITEMANPHYSHSIEIRPGEHNLVDLNYCLSEVTLDFEVPPGEGTLYAPTVQTSNSGLHPYGPPTPDFQGNSREYLVELADTTGTPILPGQSRQGRAVLLLPEGDYNLTVTAQVQSPSGATGSRTFDYSPLHVGCGERLLLSMGLQVEITGMECSVGGQTRIEGQVTTAVGTSVSRIEWTTPGGSAATTICTGCGSNPTFSFMLPNAGRCVDAPFTVTAYDDSGHVATVTRIVPRDTTPPVLTPVPDKTVDCIGPWSFDTPTATDDCGPATVTIVSTTSGRVDASTYWIERTWEATDLCGNNATPRSQRVTFNHCFAPPQLPVVSSGSVWHYFNHGTAPDATWLQTSYTNVLVWDVGLGPFGYGHGDEATLLSFGAQPDDKYITTYFRQDFMATNVGGLYDAVLRLKCDDGAIVYLNGAEVFRRNMPTGMVTYATLALGAAVGPDEKVFFETNLDPALLLEGTNVLAVEVHQVGPASPDLSFDLELLGIQPVPNTIVSAPVGYSTFANNYNRGGNRLNELIPTAADGTLVLKWDAAAQAYRTNVYDAPSATWTPNVTLFPGEGAWLCSPIPQTFVFSGDIPKHPYPQDLRSPGLRLVSCGAPIAATSFEQLMEFEPIIGDQVLVYEGGFAAFVDPNTTPATHTSVFTVTGWVPSPPNLTPGHAVFVNLVAYPVDPRYFLQPQSQTVTEGDPVTFTAYGYGDPPLAYQWQRNGQELHYNLTIPANHHFFGTELTLPSVGLADNGSIYSLLVSNSTSQAFSSNAVLTVNRPVFAQDLLVYDSFNYLPNTQVVGQNGGAGWTGVWGGLAPMYSYFTNRVPGLIPPGVAWYPTNGWSAAIDLPANSSDHIQRSLDLLTTNHSELWFSVIISGDGQSGDDRFIMQFDSGYPLEMGAYGLGANSQAHWTIQNRPDAMGPVVKTNEPTLLVLQMVNSSLTTHQLNLYVNPSPGLVGPLPPDATWTLAGWRLDRLILLQYIVSGGLTHHALDEIRIGTSYAQINYDPHVRITTQPQSQTVTVGDPVDLSVEASGAPPLLYQWFRDGQSLAGVTYSNIHISQASVADAGVYSVLVANSLGSQLSSNAVLTVGPPAFAANLLVYDSFAYPSNTQVVGQNGGTGWTGPWTGQIPMFSYFTNQASSLLPPGDPDYATAGGSAAIDLPANTFNYLARTLDLETTNYSELWFGVIISPNGLAVGDRFILRFGSTLDLEIGAYSPGANAPVRWTIEQELTAMGPIVTPNVPSLLLLQMVNTSLTAHQFNLYVNPPSGSTAPSPDATWVLPNTRLDQLTQVQYVVNGGLTHHALDEIRIGTSYAAVARPGVPITFQGLANRPLGQASLFGGTGGAVSVPITIANIGSNGLDGVSVSLDGFEFGALTLGPAVTNILPTGGELTMRVYGEVNGATNQVISTLHATSVGGAVELRAEFNALSDVPACGSLVYDGATLVASASGVTGAVARVLTPTAGDRWLPYLPANGLLWAEVDFPSRPTIQLAGDGAAVQGTRLLIAPNVARLTYPDIKFDPAQISTDTGLELWYKDPGTLGNWGQPGDPPPSHVIIGAISHIDLLAKNVPQLTILGEEAGMFGFAHRASGSARLTVQRRGDLLGSPELDLDTEPNFDPAGPSATIEWSTIAIPIADTAIPIADTATPIPDQSVRWLDPDPSNSLPMGAFLQAKIISPAPLNTTNSPQILGSIQAMKMASNTVALTADFSAAGATNTIVEIWNQGVITTNIVGPVPMTVTVDQMPSYFASPGVPYGGDPQMSHPFPQDLSFGWASSVLISIKGTNALGDQIRFRAPGAPYTNVAFGSFGLSIGGGLNHLGIIDEQASPPGEYFDGLAFLPIGQATLTTVSNELVVSNLTVNADFGASVALGDSSGAALRVVGLDGINPNGDLRVRTFGMLDGVPDQLIGAIIASKLGTNIQFSTDLSPVLDPANPFYFNVAVYDGPNLVGVSGLVTNPVVTIESLAPAPAGPYVFGPWHLSRPGSFATHIDLPERVPITIAGHPPVLGTRIVFDACINCGDPGIPTTDIGAISRVEVVASGLSSFRITQAQLDMYQQLHSALGSAHLFAVGSELHVNNLVSGPDSPDGVEFPTVDGDKNGFAAYWRQIAPFPYKTTSPPPWFLRVTALGALSPIPDQSQILASSQVTRVGNTNEISADFAPIGPQSLLIEVLSSNAVVLSTVLNGSTGVVGELNGNAVGTWVATPYPSVSDSLAVSWFAWPATQIQVNNQLVTGDQIRITAQPPFINTIAALSSVRLQAFGIPELVLVNDAQVPSVNSPTNCIDFHCPTNLTAYACGSNCVSVPFTVTATDRCTSNSVYVVTDLPSGNCFQLGTTWVHSMAYANGQIGQCSFPVTVLSNCTSALPTLFAGLANTPTGGALAQVVSNRLVIANVNNSALYGVSVDLGQADSGSVVLDHPFPQDLPSGASITVKTIGTVNDLPGQVLGVLSARRVDTNIEFSCDFSGIGAVAVTALVYEGSNLVAQAHDLTGVVASESFPSPAPALKWTPFAVAHSPIPGGYLEWTGATASVNPNPPVLTLPGSQPVNGDRLVVIPQSGVAFLNPATPGLMIHPEPWFPPHFPWTDKAFPDSASNSIRLGTVSRLEVTAQGSSQFSIASLAVGMFGQTHQAVGQAQLRAVAGALVVGNIPDTGTNGVDIAGFPTVDGDVEARWLDPDLSNSLSIGAFLQAGLSLSLPSDPGPRPPSLEVRKTAPSTLTIGSDPSGSGAGSRSVEVWRDGVLVGVGTASNAPLATVDSWPTSFSSRLKIDPDLPYVGLGWKSNVVFNLNNNGPTLAGNELRVGFLNITNPPPSTISLRLGNGLSNLTIIGEASSPAGLYFQGLAHQAIGNATLQVVSNVLVVSNLVANATNGASISLGDAEFAEVAFDGLSTPPLPFTVRAFGLVGGVPDQFLGKVIATADGTNVIYSADLPSTVTNVTVITYNGETITSYINMPNPNQITAAILSSVRWSRALTPDAASLTAQASLTFPAGSRITVAGQSATIGDRVVIIATPYPSTLGAPDVSAVSRLDIVTSGAGPLRIKQEQLGAFHQFHRAVGQSRLLGLGESVRLANLVSSAASPDGVEFPLAGKDAFNAYWRTLDPFNQIPPGPVSFDTPFAVLVSSAHGKTAGGQEQLLGSSQITSEIGGLSTNRLGAQKEIAADFSSMGATSRSIEVWRSNQVVFSTTISGGTGAVAEAGDWPISAGSLLYPTPNLTRTVAQVWRFYSPGTWTQFLINNQLVTGDEIRIGAVNGLAIEHLSKFSLQASGLSEINLVAESEHASAPIVLVGNIFSGNVIISWDAQAGQVLQAADTADGPWMDVPGATPPFRAAGTGVGKFFRVVQR